MTIPFLSTKISVRERAFLARQLATMLGAGVHLTQGISMIAEQVRNKRLQAILYEVVADINKGLSFSTATAKHPDAFDLIFVSIAKSGEASGKLDEVLEELATQLEEQDEFLSSIRGALIYPAFILVVMIGVAILMSIKVIPQLKQVFLESGANLPWQTQMLVFISDTMIKFWYIYIIGFLGVVAFLRWYMTTQQGILLYNQIQIKNPTGIGLSVYMARFAGTLSMLTRAGVPIIQSVNITAEVMSNEIYRRSLKEVVSELERGIPLSTPILKNSYFPAIVGQMLTVGEQTGQIDTVLGKLAKFYRDEASRRVHDLSRLFEPAIIVVIGLGVAFIVFSILVPIYNIAQLQ